MSDSIPKKVLQNLGQIATETGKEAVKQVGEITSSIITGKELLGNIKPMTDEELAKKKQEDRAAVAGALASQGRNVEGEMKQVRDEKEQKEEQDEQRLLQELQAKRDAEEAERREFEASMLLGQTRRKGPQGPSQPKKKQQPDPASMSSTSEFKGKVD